MKQKEKNYTIKFFKGQGRGVHAPNNSATVINLV